MFVLFTVDGPFFAGFINWFTNNFETPLNPIVLYKYPGPRVLTDAGKGAEEKGH